MRILVQVLSGLALLGVVVTPTLFYTGSLAEEQLKNCLLASTALWFVTAPFWMELRERG